MSPQQKTAASFAKTLMLFIIVGAASTFIIKTIYGLAAPQSPGSTTKIINGKRLADKEPLSERVSFTENGPTGRWSASIIPDLTRNSSNSPVVVIGNDT